jgi:hypothetical protein
MGCGGGCGNDNDSKKEVVEEDDGDGYCNGISNDDNES